MDGCLKIAIEDTLQLLSLSSSQLKKRQGDTKRQNPQGYRRWGEDRAARVELESRWGLGMLS